MESFLIESGMGRVNRDNVEPQLVVFKRRQTNYTVNSISFDIPPDIFKEILLVVWVGRGP